MSQRQENPKGHTKSYHFVLSYSQACYFFNSIFFFGYKKKKKKKEKHPRKEKRKNQHPQTIFYSNTHQYLLNFDHLIINHLAFETKLGSITLIFGRNQTLPPVFAKLLLPLNSILAKGSYPLVPIVFRHTLFPHFDM